MTEWIFTFGFGHVHPHTGERLANTFIRVSGEDEEAREKMYARFGRKWAFQYATEEQAGVEKYHLRELDERL